MIPNESKYARGHQPETSMELEFLKLVKKAGDDECWIWQGNIRKTGYGWFQYKGKKEYSHWVAYVLANGSIPEGLQVLHECDNPPCCNPKHLFAGTHQDNMADMNTKHRGSHGTENNLSKLTEEQVLAIREEYRPYVKGLSIELAEKYGVTRFHIVFVARGGSPNRGSWKHLD